HSDDSRVQQAFLRFSKEGKKSITAKSHLDVCYEIERESLTRSLRTSVGLSSMDITDNCDFIAHKPYNKFSNVCRASGFKAESNWDWPNFWINVQNELQSKKTRIVVSRRINPFSPHTFLNSFFSNELFSPSNQVNVIIEEDPKKAQTLCVILNSSVFFANFFLLKEESTGRFIDIRFYDLYEMKIFPSESDISSLVKVFKKYGKVKFPPLRNQFDIHFDERYKEFWEKEKSQVYQQRLFSVLGQLIQPSPERLNLDLDVCKALNIKISKDDLIKLYAVFVKEMIIIRHLTRD
ncbi:MAG: SAM-dependent DNA methyltransferase, partial [bacterium]